MRILVKHIWTLAISFAAGCGGGGGGSTATPPCEAACEDGVALLALRNAIKLAYNVTLLGQPTGPQDKMTDCPLGGTVRISGTATSNAVQGATNVSLTYVFAACAYAEIDTDPKQTFQMTFDGSVKEDGVISVQPTSTTALRFHSDAMTFSGTVYAPAKAYEEKTCTMQLEQNSNNLSGTICGRDAGTTL